MGEKAESFRFGVVGLDHGHINGMTGGLVDAGAEVTRVWDPDAKKVARFCERFGQANVARSEAEVLEDGSIRLVASAIVPSERCALGLRVLAHDKDYFVDKAPMTTLAQLAEAREAAARTGRKYAVYYGERLHNEGSIHAGRLVREGAIGRVLQVINLAPHRLSASDRPDWFWKKDKTGGILTDIGSHQVEQFLYYADTLDAEVVFARAVNLHHPEYPEFEDFGEAVVESSTGARQYLRVDWFTPDGLRAWGDGRLFILGTEGTIEVRKSLDLAREGGGNLVFIADAKGERCENVTGKVGFPWFGALIRDCLERTETAMTQEHAFKAAQLSLEAQAMADERK